MSELLQCIPSEDQAALADICAGVDTFFLHRRWFLHALCLNHLGQDHQEVLLWNLLDSHWDVSLYRYCGWVFAYDDVEGGPITFIGYTDFFLMCMMMGPL